MLRESRDPTKDTSHWQFIFLMPLNLKLSAKPTKLGVLMPNRRAVTSLKFIIDAVKAVNNKYFRKLSAERTPESPLGGCGPKKYSPKFCNRQIF